MIDDDLVRRLRTPMENVTVQACFKERAEAADRIEELEADIKGLRHMILDQINSTGDDPEIMAATRAEWAARAKAAEAKLARATEALEAISSDMCEPRDDASAFLTCQSILAELKGDSDD